jgi:hypothetical protein
MFSHDLSSCVDQVILSDGSAESKIHSPMQAKEGESRLG